MGVGEGLPRFQQDADPGTAWGCSVCTWVCTHGAVGAGRMDGPQGARGCLMRSVPHPPAGLP